MINISITSDQSLEKANEFKEKGNKSISSGEFQEAYDFYSIAISICPLGPQSHLYYSNRAASLTGMGKYELAIEGIL